MKQPHRVVVAVLADEGYAAIAWTAGAAFAHQITEGLREERWGKHTWGRGTSSVLWLCRWSTAVVKTLEHFPVFLKTFLGYIVVQTTPNRISSGLGCCGGIKISYMCIHTYLQWRWRAKLNSLRLNDCWTAALCVWCPRWSYRYPVQLNTDKQIERGWRMQPP